MCPALMKSHRNSHPSTKHMTLLGFSDQKGSGEFGVVRLSEEYPEFSALMLQILCKLKLFQNKFP